MRLMTTGRKATMHAQIDARHHPGEGIDPEVAADALG